MANEQVTTQFKVDISQLTKAMQEAKRSISLANSEFKAVSSSMENWSKSTDGLKAKLKNLDSNLTAQNKILENYKEQLRLIEKEYGENSAQADKMRVTINNQQATINKTKLEIEKYSKALDELEEAQENISDGSDEAEKGMKDLKNAVDGAGESAKKAEGGFTVMKGALSSLVADGIRNAIDGLKNLASSMVGIGSGFESAMSEVGAISGASAQDLELLSETAKKFGASTQFSAQESADALKYMALAGWDAKTSCDALGGVLSLASASGMDLAQASDMCTDYLSAFGMTAEQSGYFADLLAYAQGNANTSAEQLGEAYKNCGANLKSAGQDVETVTSAISMMSNQGLKGSEAGTALNAIMRDMTAKMKEGKIAIGETSVEVMDASGNYRDLSDILKDVENATNGMGEAEKAMALKTTFTADSTKGLNLLLNAGIDTMNDFEKSLRGCEGTAQEMSDTMNDNLEGDLKSLNSAWEDLNITVYEGFGDSLRGGVQIITNEFIPGLKGLIQGTDGAREQLNTAFSDMFSYLLQTLTTLLPTLITVGVDMIMMLMQGIVETIPRLIYQLQDIIPQIIDAISGQLPTLIDSILMSVLILGEAIVEMTPKILSSIVELVDSLVKQLPAIFENLISEISTFFQEAFGDGWLPDALMSILNAMTDLVGSIVEALPDIIQTIVTYIPEIVDTVINGLLSCIPQLVQGAITLFLALVETIPIVLPMLVNAIPLLVNGIIDALLNNIPLLVKASIQLFMAIVQAIPTIVIELAKAIPSIVVAIVEGLGAILGHLGELFGQVLSLVGQWVANMVTKAGELGTNFLASIVQFFQQLPEKMGYFIGFAMTKVVQWGVDLLEFAFVKIPEFIATVIKFISELPVKFVVWLVKTIEKLADWEKDMKAKGKQAIKGLLDSVVEGAKKIPSRMGEIGMNIVDSVWNGIVKAKDNFVRNVKNFFGGVVDGVKDALGIHSPSKVFSEIGAFCMKGLNLGITTNADDVLKTMKRVSGSMVATANASFGDIEAVGSRAGGSTVYNFYQTNNSPKHLDRLEIYRQTKNLLGYVGG